jgi:hypothetical protein
MPTPRLFVSIAAYRDPDLGATLQDALDQAAHPGALHLGVLEQSPTPTALAPSVRERAGQITYLHLHHSYSRGPCWARAMIATAVRQETHFLQIDSHTRFDPGWDLTLLQTCEALAQASGQPKLILSTYPCAFEISDGQAVRKPMPGHALVLRPQAEATLSGPSPVLPFHAVPTPSPVPLAGCHVGAGCLFAPTRLLQEVPLDPWLYFHGEEQNLAVRAWTHGWDIWHPGPVGEVVAMASAGRAAHGRVAVRTGRAGRVRPGHAALAGRLRGGLRHRLPASQDRARGGSGLNDVRLQRSRCSAARYFCA